MISCSSHLFNAYLFFVFINLINTTRSEEVNNETPQNRNGRFFSMFEIIKFPNNDCPGDSKTGTCYTSAECDDRDGTKDGECADGFGVCCTFDVESGAKISENNTYFKSSGKEASGTSKVSVCPGDNICQLRLDFISFVISGPYSSTDTLKSTTMINGVPKKGDLTMGNAMAQNSQCIIDSFSVTSPSGNSPPVICGTNTGEHMYVDASSSYCNALGFSFGSSAAASERQWEIKISYFDCDYTNLAPNGCTQYFFDKKDDWTEFKSFNYPNYHLANQNQNICFRQEGKEQICFSEIAAGDFQVSARMGTYKVATKSMIQVGTTSDKAGCCGYGEDGKKGGFDCLQIPDATTSKDGLLKDAIGIAANSGVVGAFCGTAGLGNLQDAKLEAAATDMLKQTICSKRTPFMVRFLTDSFEYSTEAAEQRGTKGFRLAYKLL